MQNWLSSIDDLHEILAIATLISVCVSALLVGRAQVRFAAIVTLVDAFGVLWVGAVLDRQSAVLGTELKAGLILMAYVALTWRWPDPWLMVMSALQSLTLFLLVARQIDGSILLSVSGLVRNVLGWLMLLTLAVATVQSGQGRASNSTAPQP